MERNLTSDRMIHARKMASNKQWHMPGCTHQTCKTAEIKSTKKVPIGDYKQPKTTPSPKASHNDGKHASKPVSKQASSPQILTCKIGQARTVAAP
jgi:hypothetical protein